MIESIKSKLPTSRNTSTVVSPSDVSYFILCLLPSQALLQIVTSYDLMVRRKKEFLDLSLYVVIFVRTVSLDYIACLVDFLSF